MTVDLSRIDWNLVPVLDALLSERNVSRAARRLSISQPAASKALARLRRLYEDDLLVRRGNAYVLTPLGEHLAPVARRAVGATRTVVETGIDLDPGTLARSFTIAGSDYAQTVLAPALRDTLAMTAPQVRIDFVQPFALAPTGTDVLPHVDGWVSPREVFADRPHVGRLTDEWACVVATDHPVNEHGLTIDDLACHSWVVPTVAGRRLDLQLTGLRAYGIEAEIAMSTDTFITIPFLVGGTDRIGLLQRRVAEIVADAAGVTVHACPWAVPPLEFTLWYDPAREADPVHRWFRDLVADCMTDISGLPTAPSA